MWCEAPSLVLGVCGLRDCNQWGAYGKHLFDTRVFLLFFIADIYVRLRSTFRISEPFSINTHTQTTTHTNTRQTKPTMQKKPMRRTNERRQPHRGTNEVEEANEVEEPTSRRSQRGGGTNQPGEPMRWIPTRFDINSLNTRHLKTPFATHSSDLSLPSFSLVPLLLFELSFC